MMCKQIQEMNKAGRLNLQPKERSVSGQPERSILKKNAAGASPDQQLLFNKIEPNTVINTKVGEAMIGQTTLKNNKTETLDAAEGHGGHTKIIDQRFEQYLQGQRKLAYEMGEQKRAIKNLQFSLQERISMYEASDAKIWRLSETQADIALNFAIQSIRLKKMEEAADYLATARKSLEPLPGSEWSERHEWHVLRRDLYKNIAIFHQGQEEWQKAFDNLRIVISHEKRVGDNTANSSLTCGILLSKMNRFAESIEYAQEACNEAERALQITHNKPLSEFRYQGKNRETMEEKDKQFTTYAIANHLVGKALLNLQYFKEARYFLQKASTACTKCLNVPKKDLSIAISNDMAKVTQVSRGNLKNLTDQQVKSALVTIKTDLATRAMSGIGGDRIEQRTVLKALEDQVQQEQLQEEEGGMFRFEETSQNAKKDTQNTNDKAKSPHPQEAKPKEAPKQVGKKPKPKSEQPEARAEDTLPAKRKRREDPDDAVPQRQREQPKSGQKQSAEQADDFMDINKYKKLANNLKRTDQRMYNEDQEADKKSRKSLRSSVAEDAVSKATPAQPSAQGSQKKSQRSVSETPAQPVPSATEKYDKLMQKRERKKRMASMQNIKQHSQNLAAEGADQDMEGVKYSHERSVKTFLRARKQQIRELNKELGYSESDQSMGPPEKREERKPIRGSESPDSKLPPVQKARSVSRSQALAKGMSTGEEVMKQGGRREFISKKLARNDDNSAVDNVLAQLASGIQIKKQEQSVERTPSVSEHSELELVEEIKKQLANQLQQKDEVVVEDSIMAPEPAAQENALFDQDIQAAEDEKVLTPVEQQNQIEPVKAGGSKPKQKEVKRIVNGKLEISEKPEKSKSPKAKKSSRVNTGLKAQRKHGEPIEQLSTLKRQGTPPLKKDKEDAHRQKLIEKHTSAKQPSQRVVKAADILRGGPTQS